MLPTLIIFGASTFEVDVLVSDFLISICSMVILKQEHFPDTLKLVPPLKLTFLIIDQLKHCFDRSTRSCCLTNLE